MISETFKYIVGGMFGWVILYFIILFGSWLQLSTSNTKVTKKMLKSINENVTDTEAFLEEAKDCLKKEALDVKTREGSNVVH